MGKQITDQDVYQHGIFDNLGKSATENLAKLAALDAGIIKTTTDLHALLSVSDQNTQKGLNDIFTFTEKINQQSKRTVDNEKRKAANQKLQEKIRLDEIKQAKAREKSIDDYNKKLEKSTKIANEAARPYRKLEQALALAKRQYLDLAAAGLANTKAGREALRTVDQLRGKYESINKAVGNNQFAVGRYTDALGKLGQGFRGVINLAGQFGAALSGVALARNALQTIIEFDNSIADLSAITGLAGKDLDFFRTNAVRLGVDVKGGATAVVEAYKLIASAKPELLDNAAALNKVTEAAILLARASGMELPDAATALTDAMNQFGASSDQAGKFVDVLAAGAKFGSAEIPQITEALLRFGAVAKTANVSVQESTGLIEALAEKGLKGADAGTALRNVMLKLNAPDALGKDGQRRLKQLGINFDDLSDKSKPFADRLEALKPLLQDNGALVKVFGTENAVAATTLLSSVERIKDLTAAVDENGVALEQADARSKTIAEAFNRLKETFNGMILEFANGSNAASGLAGTIDFLRKNLSTIVTVIGHLIKAFLIFKAVVKATEIKDAWKDFKKLGDSANDAGTALTKAGERGKAMGSALKSIGWAALIAFALEFAQQLYSIADGASQVATNLSRLNQAKASGAETAAKRLAEAQKQRDQEILFAQDQRNKKLITEAELIKLTDQAQKRYAKTVENFASLSKKSQAENYKQYTIELSRLDNLKTQYGETRYEYLRTLGASLRMGGSTGNVAEATTDEVTKSRARNLDALIQRLSVLEAQQGGLNERNSAYTNELFQLTKAEIEAVNALDDNTESTAAAGKAVKANTTTLRENNDELKRRIDLLESERKIRNDIGNLQEEQQYDPVREIQDNGVLTQKNSIDAGNGFNVDGIEYAIAYEFDLRRKAAEEQAAFDMKTLEIASENERQLQFDELRKLREERLKQANLTDAERTKIEENYQKGIAEIDAEFLERQRMIALEQEKIALELKARLSEISKEESDRINQINDELIDYQIANDDKLNEANRAALDQKAMDDQEAMDAEKKRLEEMQEFRETLIKKGLDLAIEASKKRESLLDEEIAASQKLSDSLRERAGTDNAVASESLAAQDAITEKKIEQKRQEQKRQQFYDELKLLYEATQNYVDKGDSIPKAAGKALLQVQGLKAIFGGLKGFLKGTKGRLGDEHTAFAPGPDGHIIRADGSEGILTGKKMDALEAAGMTTTDDIVNNAIAFKRLATGNIVPVTAAMRSESDKSEVIAREIRDLKAVIKAKKETHWSIEFKRKMAHAIIETTKTPTKTTHTRHKNK